MSVNNIEKIAVITGGGRGIGSSISETLARDGFHVIIAYENNEEAANIVKTKIIKRKQRATCVRINVNDRNNIKESLNKIRGYGTICALINNAAIAQEKPFLEITDDDWDRMLGVNLKGSFMLTQEVLPEMIKNKFGRIVNIASIGGQWGGINQIHYASSKAGLIGLTRSIAKTFSAYGITCNAISPGLIKTDMSAKELSTSAGKEKVKSIPVGRLGLSEEVASAVSFLVSIKGSYITGQTLNLNGGMFFSS